MKIDRSFIFIQVCCIPDHHHPEQSYVSVTLRWRFINVGFF